MSSFDEMYATMMAANQSCSRVALGVHAALTSTPIGGADLQCFE
jgi:hypothetical protein